MIPVRAPFGQGGGPADRRLPDLVISSPKTLFSGFGGSLFASRLFGSDAASLRLSDGWKGVHLGPLPVGWNFGRRSGASTIESAGEWGT
jgi:hypothetical protein